MRKTSYDGADSSSITSGKDSDTKKSAATFNKMTKSSIKRKVQNFSHESDDAIIEPLLQTDKEKIEIANRSAKYLLNKPKTESLLEKDNKVTDGYADKSSIPITVSSTSNMITHNVKESPASTSYICGSAPIHNHMNTNIFSSYEASTGLITTKNQILVEIDNSKTGRCSPGPLIFTTAKIHTDSKTKVMEPIQVTPVPILSTIESNIIKAGGVPDPDTKTSSLTKTSSDDIKVSSGKPEVNTLQNDKNKKKSPSVAHAILKSEALNENVKKSITTTSSLESSANLIYQAKKLQLSNIEISPAAANLTSNKNTSLKEQPFNKITTTQTNISITDTVKKLTEKSTSASSSNNTSGKYSSIEKSKESFQTLDSKDNNILPEPLNLQNQDNVQKISLETPQHQKTLFNSKDIEFGLNTSVSSNKKLHRQKNASNEATNDSVNTILKKDTQNLLKQVDNNLTTKTVKVPKQENKSDSAPRDTLPIATKVLSISTLSSAHPPNNSIKVSSSTEMKDRVLVSTPKPKPISETVNSKPTLSDACKVVTKSQTKSSVTTTQTDVKDIKESATMSSKPTSFALSSSKLTAVSVSAKPEILSSSPRLSHSVKTNPSLINSTVTTVNTPLPSYIVPTSKTKIGFTMTSNTPAVTLKSQIQKPIVNVHTTSAFATSGAKTSPSSSDANGTKHTVFSKQAKSNAETIKKDGRA